MRVEPLARVMPERSRLVDPAASPGRLILVSEMVMEEPTGRVPKIDTGSVDRG